MKLICKPAQLQRVFLSLLSEYKQYYWTTAWAGVGSEPFKSLKRHNKRIRQIVVGLHFYQTHPDFIKEYLDHDGVRFIKQAEGTFHPKLFLFYNSDNDWALLTGSSNFTKEAFTRNTEACVLIQSSDPNSRLILKQAWNFIDSQWAAAARFDPDELDDYLEVWEKQKRRIQALSGQYGNVRKQKPTPAFQVGVMTMSWEVFMKMVKTEATGALEKRLRVIGLASSLFRKVEAFKDLSPNERKFIAGLQNNLPEGNNWGYFGSMQGAGKFAKTINSNNFHISDALDEIPLTGQITESHYRRFMTEFLKAFIGAKNPIATATRLLAMKRPDVFVCIDSRNHKLLSKHFGIKKADITVQTYWEVIIERIMDSEWWVNPKPTNAQERKVSESRAAFLDALYYTPK